MQGGLSEVWAIKGNVGCVPPCIFEWKGEMMDVLRCQGCGFLFRNITDYYNLEGSCCDAKKIGTLEKLVAELEKDVAERRQATDAHTETMRCMDNEEASALMKVLTAVRDLNDSGTQDEMDACLEDLESTVTAYDATRKN